MEKKKNLLEFLRYCVVGGISAVVDLTVNYLFLFKIFKSTKDDTLFVVLSVAAGFVVGMLCNYILSNIFVFRSEEQKARGKSLKAFFVYFAVGLVGFGLTELLTFAGTFLIGDEGVFYLLLSCVVKGIVLIWNYIGRKIFVYKGN